MSAPVTVLMYHAIADAGIDAASADPHYAVTRARFGAQVDAIRAAGGRARSVASRLGLAGRCTGQATGDGGPRSGTGPAFDVCLTFDDGLASNAWAAEHLAAAAASADFFVNPSTIGSAGHLDWPALRRMADAGMSIQSHGLTHRYLDALDAATVRAELADSRKAIEDGIGRAVTLYAPAGGRMPAGFARLAAELGYRAVCSSRVGLWRADAGAGRWRADAGADLGADPGADPGAAAAAAAAGAVCPEIPRLAVLAGTSPARFERWLRQAPAEILAQTARHRLLAASKRLLGNGGHERLRGLLLAARARIVR